MATCNGKHGAKSRFAVQQGSTFDTGAIQLPITRETIQNIQTITDSDGIRGTRSLHSNRARITSKLIRGSFWLHPGPSHLDTLLPLILGAAEATDVFALDEAIPGFKIGKDLDGDVYEYTDCVVARAVFQGRAQGLVELRVDVVGKTEATSSWPAMGGLGSTLDDQPYVFADAASALELPNSTAVEMQAFRLTVDNFPNVRFVNSLTPTSLCAQKREITLEVVAPFYTTAEKALYATTEITGGLTFTNSTVSTDFDFAALRPETRTPVIPGKEEITHSLRYTARETASAKELVVTNDSTV